MGWEELAFQPRVADILGRVIANGKIAHAYLFAGPQGSGKALALKLFAQSVNCESPDNVPCGVCKACSKIARSMDPEHSIHPDIMHLEPGKWISADGRKQASQTIVIDAVRDLCSKLYAAPLEAKRRIVVIHESHTMQIAAQNAILKTLEEPLERIRTVFVLLTDRQHMLLPTIRSRCQEIRFGILSRKRLIETLIERGIDAAMAENVAIYADGNLQVALELAQIERGEGGAVEDQRAWLDLWHGLVTGKIREVDKVIATLTGSRDDVARMLAVLLGWHRDLLVFVQGGAENRLVHRDRLEQLHTQAASLSPGQVIWRMERLGELRDSLQIYARSDIALSTLLMQIAAGVDLAQSG